MVSSGVNIGLLLILSKLASQQLFVGSYFTIIIIYFIISYFIIGQLFDQTRITTRKADYILLNNYYSYQFWSPWRREGSGSNL